MASFGKTIDPATKPKNDHVRLENGTKIPEKKYQKMVSRATAQGRPAPRLQKN